MCREQPSYSRPCFEGRLRGGDTRQASVRTFTFSSSARQGLLEFIAMVHSAAGAPATWATILGFSFPTGVSTLRTSRMGAYRPIHSAPGNLNGDRNALFPVKFEKYGRFVNLARVHLGYVHCKVAQGNLGMYTADGLAICLTPGSVVESALVVQAENRRKSIDIQLYTQEYQRFQAVICARLYPGSIELRAQVKGDAVQFNTRPGASSLSNLFCTTLLTAPNQASRHLAARPKK